MLSMGNLNYKEVGLTFRNSRQTALFILVSTFSCVCFQSCFPGGLGGGLEDVQGPRRCPGQGTGKGGRVLALLVLAPLPQEVC